MTENQSTRQIGNIVGGDQAGGNIINHHYGNSRSRLSHLYELYEEEVENDTEVSEIIRELLHYIEETGDIKGLVQKLEEAEKDQEFIEYAKIKKELIAKRILKRDLSPAAQKIFAYLLGKVESKFEFRIVPKIKAGLSEVQIFEALDEEVFEPVFNELETNPLGITMAEIVGMLFFLTGKCHVKWQYDADV